MSVFGANDEICPVLAGALLPLLLSHSPKAGAAALEIRHHKGLDLHIINFEGEIKPGSFKSLQKLIDEAITKNPVHLVFLALNSPGGSVEDALDAGRLVRNRGVGTMLLPGATCNSACSFVFFAGFDAASQQPRRLAFAGSRIGVHSSNLRYKSDRKDETITTIDPNEIFAFLQERIARVLNYLNQMKVPPRVQERIFATPSKAIYYLTEDEKLATDVVTVAMSNGRWTAEKSSRVLMLPASLFDPRPPVAAATAPVSANTSLHDQRADAITVAASGSTRITFMPARPYPGFPHRPRTIRATWSVGTRPGAICLDVNGQDPGRTLGITVCSRQGNVVGTLEFSGGMLEAWYRVAAVSVTGLSGSPQVVPIVGQEEQRSSWPGAASDVARLHFAAKGLPGGLNGSSELYLMRFEFSPTNSQEISVFIPAELRTALQQAFAPSGTTLGLAQ